MKPDADVFFQASPVFRFTDKADPGRLVLFGPEIAFRAQPHGTFKLLFNGLWLGAIGER